MIDVERNDHEGLQSPISMLVLRGLQKFSLENLS
jgi:hypothetical protein